MAKNPEWSNNDIYFLQENYSKLSVKEICEHLGRSKDAVYQKAKEFNIKFRASKNNHKYNKILISFTESQNDYLSKFNNKSDIVRKALSMYILKNNDRTKFNFEIEKPEVSPIEKTSTKITTMDQVKKLFEISDLSQVELAKKLNTTSSRLSEYKTGKVRITVEKLIEWCEILKIDIKTLF